MSAEIKAATKFYRQMARRAAKASEARYSLPPGTSRARVTTANARWMSYAEARDRAAKDLAFMVDGVEGAVADAARAALKEPT